MPVHTGTMVLSNGKSTVFSHRAVGFTPDLSIGAIEKRLTAQGQFTPFKLYIKFIVLPGNDAVTNVRHKRRAL
jgi:hypothetical protein